MKKTNVRFQNSCQETNFHFAKKSHMTKIWKTTFTKEVFNEILNKLGDCEYNYIAGLNNEFYSGAISGANQFFPHPIKMLIYAN